MSKSVQRMILAGGQWEVYYPWGLQQLSNYLAELEMIQSGVPLDTLYKDRQEQQLPMLFSASGSHQRVTGGFSSSDIERGSIAHIQVSGAMMLEGGLCTRGIKQVSRQIAEADSNPNISGILLEVNSGGGQSTAGAELQNALKDVRSNGNKPVGVYTQLLASAALRGTLPAQMVVAAAESTFVGSVGTAAVIDRQLLEDIKESQMVFYAEQSTLKNKADRALREGDAKPLIARLTSNAQIFIDEVMDAKNIVGTEEQVQRVRSGDIFTAKEALQIGLIDQVGTLAETVQSIQSMASAPGRSFSFGSMANNQNSAMNLSELYQAIKNKFNVAINNDASVEDAVNAINGAESQTDVIAALQSQMTEAEEALQKAGGEIKELQDSMGELKQTVSTFKEANDELKQRNEELDQELVEVKGKRSGGHSAGKPDTKKNTKAKSMQQFNTGGEGKKEVSYASKY